LQFMLDTPFTEEQSPDNRYYYGARHYPSGDAITLRMMINEYKPKRMVEIGSGFSSACTLDSADHAGLTDFRLTCIEPYPDRLRSILRPEDWERVTLIESPVQVVPASVVEALEPNDMLFIDSTHVLKTGSDVHYELFYLLPKVKPGVLVHFHDVRYPFEYPDPFIFNRNNSWTEAYALRAFLMYNDKFRVVLWNSALADKFAKEMKSEFRAFMRNFGSSIWLERLE